MLAEQPSLLGLPIEIRINILRILLVSKRPIADRSDAFKKKGDHPDDQDSEQSEIDRIREPLKRTTSITSGLQPQILQTCSQIYLEGVDLLHMNTVQACYLLDEEEVQNSHAFVLGERSIQSALKRYPSVRGVKKWCVEIRIWAQDAIDVDYSKRLWLQSWASTLSGDMRTLSQLPEPTVRLGLWSAAHEGNLFHNVPCTAIRALRCDNLELDNSAHMSAKLRSAIAEDVQSRRAFYKPDQIYGATQSFVDMVCIHTQARFLDRVDDELLPISDYSRRQRLASTYSGPYGDFIDTLCSLLSDTGYFSPSSDIDNTYKEATQVLNTIDHFCTQASNELATKHHHLYIEIASATRIMGTNYNLKSLKNAWQRRTPSLINHRYRLSSRGIWEKAKELIVLWWDEDWVLEQQENIALFQMYSAQLRKITMKVNEELELPEIPCYDPDEDECDNYKLNEDEIDDAIDELERKYDEDHI